jgi:hypothetical protein
VKPLESKNEDELLGEILYKLWKVYFVGDEKKYYGAEQIAKSQIQELIAKDYILKSEVESVLGEDEVGEVSKLGTYRTAKRRGRNQLRAEIRQKLALQTKKDM